jgi:hypothetical protein
MFNSDEGTRKHKSKGIENDEGQNETICSANNGTSNQTNCKGTTNDISIKRTIEGAKARGTTYDISTRETTKGAEARN